MTAVEALGSDAAEASVDHQARRLARIGYAFAMPATILVALLMLGPLIVVLALSFTDYTLAARSVAFVGFVNYERMLSDPSVVRAVVNSFVYVAVVVPTSVCLGLMIALTVIRRRRSRRAYEVLFFLPVTSTLVAMAVVWQYLLHGRIGPINAALSAFGLERIDFLTDPGVALYALAAIGVWQLVGFAMVLFLAGLTAIPREIYDAAAIDGADGGFDRFWRVTWPLLAPTTLFVVVTTSITAFQVFDTVATLTRGGPMGSTEVFLYRIYLEGFEYLDMGRGAALAVVFLFIVLMTSLLQVRLVDRRIHYGR